MRLLDLVALCLAFLIALGISSNSFSWTSFSEILIIRFALSNVILFAGYLAFCSAVFSACGFYRSHRLSHWNGRLYEIFGAVTVVTCFLLVLRWIVHLAFATNVFLLLFYFLDTCSLFVSRESVRLALQFVRLRGRNLRHVIIVGEEPGATALAQRIRQEVGLGYRVLKIIDPREKTK
jgi:FlaA1/EpsC-like NDP-sugar epimerase